MAVTLLEQIAVGEAPPFVSFNVEQYHEMIRLGIVPEGAPVELIDGLLVWKDRSARGADPMSQDPRHALTIKCLQRLERRLESFDCHLQLQLPITLSETSEPEPDAAIVKGQPEAYADHHPTPADVIAAMEVADSSLRFDRSTKQRKYALAGIGQYWIVNLAENQIEVYQEPLVADGRYLRRDDYRPGQVLSLALGSSGTIEVAVSEILPLGRGFA
jgi:Uma2 family endonuclease